MRDLVAAFRRWMDASGLRRLVGYLSGLFRSASLDPATSGPRQARRFSYFDAWRHAELPCDCGWRGPLRPEQAEPYESLLEFSCPNCDACLAIVTYPTDVEMLENLDELPAPERAGVLKRQQFMEEAGRLALQRPEQLPDLDGDTLELSWDFVTDDEIRYTVIRHAGTVVWRELAVWEGIDRFEDIAAMLKARYGERLRDLIPTKASEPYLYGDKLAGPDTVEGIRKTLSP
jgi:hypothetical protein